MWVKIQIISNNRNETVSDCYYRTYWQVCRVILIIALCVLYKMCGRKHDAGKLHSPVYVFTRLQIINFMEQRSSASQDVPRCLIMLKGHYLVHNSPTLVHVLRHINPVNALPFYLRSISILSFHQRLRLSIGLFPPVFPSKSTMNFLPPYVLHVPSILSAVIWSPE